MMTRKHYERAANQIRSCLRNPSIRRVLTDHFIAFFSGDNPAFDAERFRAACLGTTGVRGGKGKKPPKVICE